MSPALVIALSLIVILTSAYLFKKSAGSLSFTNLNMMSFIFWMDFLVVSYLGTIIILLLQNSNFNDLVDSLTGGFQTKLKVWMFVSYVLLAFPVGMLLAKVAWKFSPKEFSVYRTAPIMGLFSSGDSYIRYPLYFLSAISVLAVMYTYVTIGFIPILKAFTVTSEIEVMQMRTAIDRGFTGNVYLKNIFGLLLTPILTYISFGYYRKTKSLQDLVWFGIMFIATFFILTYDMSKSPFIRFLAGFLFFHILTRQIKTKTFVKYAIIGITGFILTFIVLGKKQGALSGLLFAVNDGITGRLLISQISSLYKHVEIFPAMHNFIGFSSVSQVLPFIEHSERSARIVMEIASPSWIEMDMGGVYNTLFVGEAYANFGIWGILLSPIWIGFLIQSLFVLFVRLRKTPLFLGFFTYYSYNSNLTGGMNEYIYNIQSLILFLVILFVLCLAYYLYHSKYGINARKVSLT